MSSTETLLPPDHGDRVGRRDWTDQHFQQALQTSDPADRRRLLAEVVDAHASVARSVARRYRGRGLTDDDLFQNACEGLVRATARFDPTMGFDFLSFAVPCMRGAVCRAFRDQGWMIRPPRRIQELQWQVHRTSAELSQRLHREPREAELVSALGVTPAAYREAAMAYGAFSPLSLDQPGPGGGGASLAGDLIDQGATQTTSIDDRLSLVPLLGALDEVDRELMRLRFWEELTQREIGLRLGLTQSQVSRRVRAVLDRLRAGLDDGS